VQYQQRAEQAEREQRVLAEALRDTAAALNSKLDQNVILDRILELLRRVIPYDTANVILLEGNVLRAVRSVGYEEHGHYTPELFTVRYRLEETGNFLWMVNHRRGLAIPDVWAYEGWIKNVTTDWIRSHAGAPIEVDGEVIGFLNLDSAEPNTFDDNHADILKIFADQAGIAFRNARLYDEARRHAEVLEHRVAERTSELSIEKAKLQAILDGMADGVTAVTYAEAITIDNLWDLVPVFRYTNQVLYRMLSYPSDETEIDWLHAHTMTAEEYRVWRTDLVKGLLETNYWQGEITLCRSDGSQFECETTVTGIRDDDHDLIGSITIFRDVSQEKALEQRKARFISNAAHELRTPITNLKTRLYLAQKQPERMGVHLQILEQVTDHMKNLVEYLLDLSRLERGTVALQRERLNLADIVKQVVAIQEPEAAQRDLRLLLEPAPYSLEVYADPGRINQVITNLLSNAVHHTPPGGMVSVSLQQERIDGRDMACIEVCDTGVGIRPEHIPHIFQPFFQADNGSSGLGLGLSISKEIVDLHGGDIRVESVLGQGTCFSVTLPLAVEVGEVPDQKVDPI
jgi:signal transduction histidine kinase